MIRSVNMKKRTKRNRYGFTIMEIMAVIVIMGILAGVVAVNVMGKIEKAKKIATQSQLKTLHSAVKSFYLDTGRYPSEEYGLAELVEQPADVEGYQPGGYLETSNIPNDGWGEPFIYQLNPESGKAFVIISLGADKEEGGEDLDADLYSTDAF
jgi:general secretion pathway protein G